jgi:DNA-binding NtrC family response regulator
MSQLTPRLDYNAIWYYISASCKHVLAEKIIACLVKQQFRLEKWNGQSQARIGIIFLEAHSGYEEAISFLQLQIKGKGHRVCVLNLSADLFETNYKIRLLGYGADYFFENALLQEPYDLITHRLQRWMTIEGLINSPIIRNRVAGNSLPLIETLRAVIEVAFFSSNNVLITGERGTGKEQIANIIHYLDNRKEKGELVILDCTTLKRELSGSELFGHEKGAFTGADNSREGAVALAHKGTFFLDEIIELPLNLQAEFLRVVQEGTYKKVGGNSWRYSSFRLVSATNKDLRQSALKGEFRSDLLDRIETTVINIPSLNERREDIPAIIDFYVQKLLGKEVPPIEKEVYDILTAKDYPGNIRQLKNIIGNMLMRYSGNGPITIGDLRGTDFVLPANETAENWFESNVFLQTLQQAIEAGYDLKQIEEKIQMLATKITLQKVGKSSAASRILGKSERWIQMQKSKERG